MTELSDEMKYARFASLKGRLNLESKGLKFRGPAIRGLIAAEFGLTPRAPYAAFIAHCEVQMAILLAKKGAPA